MSNPKGKRTVFQRKQPLSDQAASLLSEFEHTGRAYWLAEIDGIARQTAEAMAAHNASRTALREFVRDLETALAQVGK